MGCGLLVERVAGQRLPGALVPPVGFVVLIVVPGLATLGGGTARAGPWLCSAAAVAGFALAGRARFEAFDSWAFVAAACVFLVYGAPVIFSGDPTFTGYIKLDDTATWLALTDRAMEHGRDLGGLAPSTYEATLGSYMKAGYPLGSFLPWGVGQRFVGQDLAWLFTPYLAYVASMLALALYSVIRRLVSVRGLAAGAAFVAAQPALLYGYAMWGGVKELVAAALIALVGALVPWTAELPVSSRRVVPLGLACGAALVAISVGGVVWLGAALLAGALLVLGTVRRLSAVALAIGAFVVSAAVAALPALVTASTFVAGSSGLEAKQVAGTREELGNLLHPLKVWQVLGIWPNGDFRLDARGGVVATVMIVLAGLAAAGGLYVAIRRRSWGLIAYVGTAAVGCALIAHYGSAWTDGKALASASPAALAAAAAGAAYLASRDPLIGAAVGLWLAAGVLWSNTLAYQEVMLAPRGQLSELEQIGDRFAGKGPALLNEYEPYGARHFLRRADGEGISELRRRQVLLRSGQYVPKSGYADIDQVALRELDPYRLLVTRRGVVSSRPPSSFRLAWRGRWYEAWERGPAKVIEHLPLGTVVNPVGPAGCADVRRLARRGGRIAYVARPPVTVLALPANFLHTLSDERYAFWLGGSVRDGLELLVDGRPVGTLDELNNTGVYSPFGSIQLTAGPHRIDLRRRAPGLRPGARGPAPPVGPLAISTGDADERVRYLPASAAGSLCGRNLDWVESAR